MPRLPNAVTDESTAAEMLDAIIRLTHAEQPFVAQVAQVARDATTVAEREQAILSLYRLSLDHEQPYVTDLADELLRWIERPRPRARRAGDS